MVIGSFKMKWRPTILDQLHLANVQRWHLMQTVKPQSVAEHSYGVAVIVLELINRMLKYDSHLVINKERLLIQSLMHDSDEVLTGDIPSPTKTLIDWQSPISIVGIDKHSKLIETLLLKIADQLEAVFYFSQNALGIRSEITCKDLISIVHNNIHELKSNSNKNIDSLVSEAYIMLLEISQQSEDTFSLPHKVKEAPSFASCHLIAICGQIYICKPKESIISALEKRQFQCNYNCRQGHCGMCKLKLIYGRVKNIGASPISAEDGYVVSCKASPITNLILEKIDE